jgi:exopolysaccharide biosynthesis polyprenyl glycosylphosphotransferase
MLKQQARQLTKIAVMVDTAMIIAAFPVAYVIMSYFTKLGDLNKYDWIQILIIPVWLFLLWHFNLYASMRTRNTVDLLKDLLKVHLIGAVIVSSAIFIFDPHGFSRLLYGGCIVANFVLISTAKIFIKLTLYYFRRHGSNIRYLLLAGCNEASAAMIDLIQNHPEWGLVIVGVAEEDPDTEELFCKVPVIGVVGDIIAYCKSNPVDEIIWCLEHGSAEQENIFYHVFRMGITFRTVLDYSNHPTTRTDLALFNGQFQVLTFYSRDFNPDQLMVKRCLDIVGSLAGLIITAVLLPVVALAIRLDSQGPIFFAQLRIGKNGRLFRCWKFRSMNVDAEARKQELLARNEMKGAMFKIAGDPRVTRVGKFIRKSSIDELPQFWNVLKGEMSLVGTRPPTPDEVKDYEHWHHKRISIKPGITGLWQVSGRNQIADFDEITNLDIKYIDNWNLWLDVKILCKTFMVVVSRGGAS